MDSDGFIQVLPYMYIHMYVLYAYMLYKYILIVKERQETGDRVAQNSVEWRNNKEE